MSVGTTSFGTQFLSMDCYELVNGVLVPKAGAPTVAAAVGSAPSKDFGLLKLPFND